MKIPSHVSQFPLYRFYFSFRYENKYTLWALADGVVFVESNVFLFFRFNLDKLRTAVLTFSRERNHVYTDLTPSSPSVHGSIVLINGKVSDENQRVRPELFVRFYGVRARVNNSVGRTSGRVNGNNWHPAGGVRPTIVSCAVYVKRQSFLFFALVLLFSLLAVLWGFLNERRLRFFASRRQW